MKYCRNCLECVGSIDKYCSDCGNTTDNAIVPECEKGHEMSRYDNYCEHCGGEMAYMSKQLLTKQGEK